MASGTRTATPEHVSIPKSHSISSVQATLGQIGNGSKDFLIELSLSTTLSTLSGSGISTVT